MAVTSIMSSMEQPRERSLAGLLRPCRIGPTALAPAAALAYAGTVSLFVIANDRTTAANAIFLQYTAPVYVALFGRWLLGHSTSFPGAPPVIWDTERRERAL